MTDINVRRQLQDILDTLDQYVGTNGEKVIKDALDLVVALRSETEAKVSKELNRRRGEK